MNSNLLVGKFYQMDPSVEDLLLADQLKEGMVVLVESVDLKADSSANASLFDQALQNRLMRTNRWCEVSVLRVIPTGIEVQIQFIGIYADGTKFVRIYNSNVGFYVKKDSLPKEEEPENTENPDADSQASEGDLKIKDGFLQYAESDREATMTLLGKQPTAVISVDLWALRDFSKKRPY